MDLRNDIFGRILLLVGEDALDKLEKTKVILFGIGGVGSWCAESLIRSGIGHLTIVDSDSVCTSNINRQLMATTKTIGLTKVEVLKQRLLDINPEAEITALQTIYDSESAASFHLDEYDYIIDAIDSLENKIHLIRTATRTKAVFFSSMGAALKLDPTKIQVAEFWKVKGCPLAAAIRRRIKKGDLPSKKFFCVYSEEVLDNKGSEKPNPKDITSDTWSSKKAQINGTVSHITAIFGFMLAGILIKDICKEG